MTAIYADPLTLWTRVLRRTTRTTSGCWIFTGATNSTGYGMVGAGRKGHPLKPRKDRGRRCQVCQSEYASEWRTRALAGER